VSYLKSNFYERKFKFKEDLPLSIAKELMFLSFVEAQFLEASFEI
jgi:hypothetical protein